MARMFRRFARSESGATAVEYAVLCMCLVLIIVVSVTALGTQVNNVYTEVTGSLK
jgi:pilus assembly protein Flp/PilA